LLKREIRLFEKPSAMTGLYEVKGESMYFARIVSLLALMAVLGFATMPSSAEAVCACSKIGQSNGSYTPQSAYGSYGYGAAYAPQQYQVQPVKSKAGKSKKGTSKSKPIAQ
jgi:hypothetical protein